jgi:F-type H+-transporting ATPase subunit a
LDAANMPNGTETQHEEGLGSFILHHLQDSKEWNMFGYHVHLPSFAPIHFLGIEIDLSITLHVLMMWFAALILILLSLIAFRKNKSSPIAVIFETIYLFIRDEIAEPNLGSKYGKKLAPFLSTIFVFILTCNLMGIIPLFRTATGNLSVTASLAIITFFMIQGYGIKEHGVIGYFKSLIPSGVPTYLIPIMIPIEIIGLFTKPFALAMRLFANMIAGHTVIFALLGLIIVLGSVFVSPISIVFAVFIDLLEILVSLLQAYIFTILSALFIGMAAIGEH